MRVQGVGFTLAVVKVPGNMEFSAIGFLRVWLSGCDLLRVQATQ